MIKSIAGCNKSQSLRDDQVASLNTCHVQRSMQRCSAIHCCYRFGCSSISFYFMLKVINKLTNARYEGALNRFHYVRFFIAVKSRRMQWNKVVGLVLIAYKFNNRCWFHCSLHSHLTIEVFTCFFMTKVRDHRKEKFYDLFFTPISLVFHIANGLFK